MKRYLARRAIRALITAWMVVTFIFFVLRLAGDPVQALVPPDIATPEILEYYRRIYGFDQPVIVQYFGYLRGLLSGSLGVSFLDGRDTVNVIGERLPATIQLTALSFLLMLSIGIPAGCLAALNHGKALDRAIMAVSVAGYSMPQYLLALILIWVFAVELRWFPSSGSERPEHIILPAVTLALSAGAILARFTRSGVLDVMGMPHVRAAEAQGWSRSAILIRDVLPNAAIPLVTVLGFIAIGLLTGSIVVEFVFGWPGIGRLLIQSVAERNLPVVQALVIMFALIAVLINFVVDLSYAVLNPKVGLTTDE
jgi:peptide/nickel transport system permease protein